MKIFKRTLCLLLVFCFVCVCFVGCGKKKGSGAAGEGEGEGGAAGGSNTVATEKPTNEYGEPSFTTAIPVNDLDFEGEEVAILYRDFIHNSREWYKASPEDELDEAIAMRNQAVEETLNVKIVFEPVPSNGNDYGEYTSRFYSMVMTDVDQNLHCYDISANFGYPTASPVLRDYTTNLLDEDLFPYFDFSLPCWNQSIVNNTTFNDQLFYVAGDINLSMFDAAYVVWHNKDLYANLREDSDPEDMQDLALEGAWTYDNLYKWTMYYDDSDPTGASGDRYGLFFTMQSHDTPLPIDAFPYAWDISFITENNDGTHEFDIIGNEKAENALNRCRKLFYAPGTYSNASANLFAGGTAMFYMDKLYSGYEANMAIRKMEDKYGLLPMPKYDVDQEDYGTTAQDYFTLMFVLDHSESSIPTKGEAISAFLQYATEESYTGVRGYYFNRIVKPKFFGTDDDSEGTVTKSMALFDIIVSNIKFDMCNIYSAQLNDIAWLWRTACSPNENGTLEKMYCENRQNFEEALSDTDKCLGLK